jgi:hypothetical protein
MSLWCESAPNNDPIPFESNPLIFSPIVESNTKPYRLPRLTPYDGSHRIEMIDESGSRPGSLFGADQGANFRAESHSQVQFVSMNWQDALAERRRRPANGCVQLEAADRIDVPAI